MSAPRIGRSTPALKYPNRFLKRTRINLGVSPNQLGDLCQPRVSGKTIRNAEEDGTIPHPWTQLAIVTALNNLRCLRDPDAEEFESTDVFPTERVAM